MHNLLNAQEPWLLNSNSSINSSLLIFIRQFQLFLVLGLITIMNYLSTKSGAFMWNCVSEKCKNQNRIHLCCSIMRHLPTGNTFLQQNDILIFRRNCLHANINLTREINFNFQISILPSKIELRILQLYKPSRNNKNILCLLLNIKIYLKWQTIFQKREKDE